MIAIMAIVKSQNATSVNGEAGPILSNMMPATTENIVYPRRPKKLLIPIIVPRISLGKLRRKSTSTLIYWTADAMIISIDKRMEDVDSGSAMFLNWNAMNPLKRKAIGRKMLIGAESAIFPMTGRANKVPIIAPVSTSL